jgi:hypothetical protein
MNINIHVDNEFAFRYACCYGNIEVVKYLMSLNRNIDIHVDNDYAFKFACKYGHLEVVKYLISLNENIYIHTEDDVAFQKACNNGRLNVVEYLWDIDKTFKLTWNEAWLPDIVKWYNEEYLKVNPNMRDMIENDKLCVKVGIMRNCNICRDEKHVIMFGCHEDHCMCKECFLEYYNKSTPYKCLYCMKVLNKDNMYITQ